MFSCGCLLSVFSPFVYYPLFLLIFYFLPPLSSSPYEIPLLHFLFICLSVSPPPHPHPTLPPSYSSHTLSFYRTLSYSNICPRHPLFSTSPFIFVLSPSLSLSYPLIIFLSLHPNILNLLDVHQVHKRNLLLWLSLLIIYGFHERLLNCHHEIRRRLIKSRSSISGERSSNLSIWKTPNPFQNYLWTTSTWMPLKF